MPDIQFAYGFLCCLGTIAVLGFAFWRGYRMGEANRLPATLRGNYDRENHTAH